MLRVVASRVRALALRLKEGTHYFQARAHLLGGRLVNDTTPGVKNTCWEGNSRLLHLTLLAIFDKRCIPIGQ